MRGFVLLTGVLAAPLLAQEVLTLDRAIELALEHNRPVASSSLEVRKFDDRIAALRTERLPHLNWYALAGQQLTKLNFRFDRGAFGVYPGIGPVPGQDTTIRSGLKPSALLLGRVDQPLSQQYRIGLGVRQLNLARDVALQQQRAQRQATVSEVKRTYYGILQAQSALESVNQSIALYRELDRVTDQYVLQQAALKSDSLEIKLRLAKAEYEALAVQNPLATQKEMLNRLLGRDISTEFQVSAIRETDWSEGDLAAARRQALDRRPEVGEARLRVQQADTDRRIKKSEYIPDLSASFTYLSPLNFGTIIPSSVAMAGLTLQWEPFDWGRKRHELAEKSKTSQQAAFGLKEAEAAVAIDVNSKFRKLQEARRLLAVARLAQEVARENLRVAKNRYSEQAALLKDVLLLQTALAESNNQYQKAVLAFWTARADFERALGEDAQ